MIEVIAASIYNMKQGKEMAYEVEYSNGSKARAIVTNDGWIRTEGKDINTEWIASKPYVVKKNAKRQGERLIETVKNFLSN